MLPQGGQREPELPPARDPKGRAGRDPQVPPQDEEHQSKVLPNATQRKGGRAHRRLHIQNTLESAPDRARRSTAMRQKPVASTAERAAEALKALNMHNAMPLPQIESEATEGVLILAL